MGEYCRGRFLICGSLPGDSRSFPAKERTKLTVDLAFGTLVLPNKKKETLVFEDDLKDTHVIKKLQDLPELALEPGLTN